MLTEAALLGVLERHEGGSGVGGAAHARIQRAAQVMLQAASCGSKVFRGGKVLAAGQITEKSTEGRTWTDVEQPTPCGWLAGANLN